MAFDGRLGELQTRLTQFEPKSLREFALLLVKGVEVIGAQIEGRCHMQQISRPRTQFGGMLARQLARFLESLIRQGLELEYAFAHVFLKGRSRRASLRG